MTTHVGIVIEERGSAIVTVERQDDRITCTGIERLPFDLRQVAARVRELEHPEHAYLIDGEGLGQALWTVLGKRDRDRNWSLYEGRGLERQALVDALLVAVEEDRFRFAADLDEQGAMTEALMRYRRQVRDDGYIGSELVVALLLAIHSRVRRPPTIY